MATDAKQLKITDLVKDLPRLRVFDEELRAYEEENPFTPLYPVVDKQTYLGIEVEVENVHKFDRNSPYWTVIEDGSLRNRGHEFITHPIRAWRAEHALTKLFLALNKDVDFSERTSIHVHMNVRTLTVAQLEALVLTYMVFERSLFSFVGNNRFNNIFCVPITETDLGSNLSELFNDNYVVLQWMKYTALNLSPIRDKGTIEFRHLSGTKDMERLMTWINLILSLKKFALRNPPEYIWNRIETLNTTSEYRMFGEEVFGELIHTVFNETFNNDVGTCVTYVKAKCIHNQFRASLYKEGVSEKSPLYKFAPLQTQKFSYRDLLVATNTAILDDLATVEDREVTVTTTAAGQGITWDVSPWNFQQVLEPNAERHIEEVEFERAMENLTIGQIAARGAATREMNEIRGEREWWQMPARPAEPRPVPRPARAPTRVVRRDR